MFPPTTARSAAIFEAAQQLGWQSQNAALRAAALRAFAHDQLPAAAAWLRVFRWSALLSTSESDFIPKWIESVKSAGVAHDGMASAYTSRAVPLSDWASADFQSWAIRHPAFLAEFFGIVQPVDYLPETLKILTDLYRHDPVKFEAYSALAIAIAVVYDVRPPSDWPHAQVLPAALARRWPAPIETFDWFTHQDVLGKTFQSLARLHAEELKFVVDVSAPLAELEWAQRSVHVTADQLEQTYGMIKYRDVRVSERQPVWTEKAYTLETILATGGICVDQTYFATQVGKARGVPTLFFHGVGNDGRHAWFGFLDGHQQWRLDAGRFAEQRFVTGIARDPQTWNSISDHELIFLSERFRSAPGFETSRILTEFAREFLAGGDATNAVKAARDAVRYERRNAAAWDVLIAAEAAMAKAAKDREATLREALIALSRYPDLERAFSKKLVQSLEGRGEQSAADFERRRLVRKYELSREDLRLQQMREELWRNRDPLTVDELVRRYNATVDRFGVGEGIAFFDAIVEPVIDYLTQHDDVAAASRAMERAQRTLKIVPGAQLAREFEALSEKLKERK